MNIQDSKFKILIQSLLNTNYPWLVVSAFLLGAGLRVYYLLGPESKLSFDEAVYAVQSLNILHGQWTVFFYNQAYTGTLQAYLSAFFFLLFGVNELWVKLIPLIFSFLFLVFTFWLAIKVFHHKNTALLSLFLAAILPTFWLNWSSRAGSGYNEMMVCGQVVFLLTLILAHDELPGLRRTFLSFLLGVVAGIGFWIQPTIAYFIIPAFVYLLFSAPWWGKRSRPFDWPLYTSIPGVLLGLLPVIMCNVSGCAATVGSLVNKGGTLDEKPWGSLYNLVTHGIPVLLGVRKTGELTDSIGIITIFVLTIYGCVLAITYGDRIWTHSRSKLNRILSVTLSLLVIIGIGVFLAKPASVISTGEAVNLFPYYLLFGAFLLLFGLFLGNLFVNWIRRKSELAPVDLLLLFCFCLILIFIVTPPFNAFVIEPRYVSPLYVALPLLVAGLFFRVGTSRYSIMKPLTIFALAVLSLSAYIDIRLNPPDSFFTQYKIDNLIAYLHQEQIRYVWANNDFAYRLMFESNGSIVTIPYDNSVSRQRLPKYEQAARQAPDTMTALVTLRDFPILPEQCREDFAAHNTCSMVYYDGFYVYRW